MLERGETYQDTCYGAPCRVMEDVRLQVPVLAVVVRGHLVQRQTSRVTTRQRQLLLLMSQVHVAAAVIHALVSDDVIAAMICS